MDDILPEGAEATEKRLLDKSTPAEKLGRLGVQTWWLRPIVFVLSVIVIIWLGYLEYRILHYVMKPCSDSGDAFVLLAVSPILAITAIVIFLLIGVFRGYRDSDMGRLPIVTIGKNFWDGNG